MADGLSTVDRVEKVIRSIFSPVRTESGARSSSSAGAHVARADAPISAPPDLNDTLAKRLGRSDLLAIGRVQIMGLDGIRKRLGRQWEQIADEVHLIVQSVLDRRLAHSDVYLRLGDAAYIMTFGELCKEEAQVKCAAISAEIWQRLVGRRMALEDIDVRTVVTNVDGRIAIQQTDLPGLFNALLDKAEAASATRAAESLLKQRNRRLTRRSRDVTVDFADDASSADPMVRLSPEAEKFEHDGGSEDSVSIQAQRALNEKLIAQYGLKFQYRPLWDVGRKALSTYVCTPVQVGRIGVAGAAAARLDDDPGASVTDIDLLVLNRVWQDLASLSAKDLRVLIACPIHYRTLVRASTAQKYRSFCHQIPEQLRQYIIFEIVGLSAGAPHSLIQDVSSSLWSSGRSIIAQLDVRRPSFENCRGSRVHAVGADLSVCEGSEAEIMSTLDRFAAGAQEAGLCAYVHGVSTLSVASAAVCAGFDYIAGDAIHGLVEVPQFIYRFNSEDLLKSYLKQRRSTSGRRRIVKWKTTTSRDRT